MVKAALRGLRRAGFDYARFHVYTLPLADAPAPDAPTAWLPAGHAFRALSADDVRGCASREIAGCAYYAGADALLFGIVRDDGGIACLQCVWHGERYASHAFWPIGPRDAASMHLVTPPAERGRGHATALKRHSAAWLRARGFERLYSRIWWTNAPSIRVSEKAGWQRVGTVLDLTLPFRRQPARLVFRGAPG